MMRLRWIPIVALAAALWLTPLAALATSPAGTNHPAVELSDGVPGDPPLGTAANPESVLITNKPVGSAAFATSQASIGTSAAAIVSARTGAPGTGRIAVTLYNAGAQTVYYGASSSVTTSTGMPLAPGASVTLDTTAAVYGIAASGTNTIGVTETY
jgi:hypothetical protein